LIDHGRTGLLATPGDVDSLVEQLRQLCTQPHLRQAMAMAAHEKVISQFDLLTNVRALGRVFSQFPRA
jgi:colanic acid/amylovoran biosynthesis glycosyltransferase